jgi:hypothetical protein
MSLPRKSASTGQVAITSLIAQVAFGDLRILLFFFSHALALLASSFSFFLFFAVWGNFRFLG